MSQKPKYLSLEFFDQYFPNASQRTREAYTVYLSRLDPSTDDVIEWIEKSNSLAEMQEKLRLSFIIAPYIPNFATLGPELEQMRTIMRTKRMQGLNFTQRRETDKQQDALIIRSMLWTDQVNEWNIFGRWLPPRRREISEFEIHHHHKEGVNHYCRSDGTFYFYNFKNDKNKPTQSYTWEDLSFVPMQGLLKAREFLHSLPDGNLFNKTVSHNYYGETFKGVNGFTVGQYRRAWATWARQTLGRTDYLKFISWMDHSLGVSVRTYSQ